MQILGNQDRSADLQVVDIFGVPGACIALLNPIWDGRLKLINDLRTKDAHLASTYQPLVRSCYSNGINVTDSLVINSLQPPSPPG